MMENGNKGLDGQKFLSMVRGGAANLEANAAIVNDLNVFPIPDGDTGENMSMTISGGLRYADGFDGKSISHAADILADGMLLSARGNSGVILSQFFAGMADSLRGKDTADIRDISSALELGVKSAYAAVLNPTEGTILTVAREASEYAAGRIGEHSTLETFTSDYMHELERSLRRTPELLSVLKEAGVIDSGGAGLYYIIDGVLKTLRGELIGESGPFDARAAAPSLSHFTAESVMEYGYCTEFLLQLQTIKTDIGAFDVNALTDALSEMGDSIVAFLTGSIVKVHIHTLTPGRVLDYCQKYGEFLTLKIENMTLQHHETTVANNFKTGGGERAKRPYALVTVATGKGICQTFADLGADKIIDGGQCKNPSAEDFIAAFDAVNAEHIFVLPNNGNIIMAAKQAAELYKEADVRVIDTRSIGEGYAALTMLSYDSNDADTIADELSAAKAGVVTGMLTRAVRDAEINGVAIHAGDYFGYTDKSAISAAKDKLDAAKELAVGLKMGEHEYIIVIYGEGMTLAERDMLRRHFAAAYPHTELFEIDGGQEVYDLLMILQ